MNRTLAKPTILIVDDTPANIQVLAEALRADYRIKVAASGKAVFEVIAKQGAPDLILLDVMMGGMDGYSVCRILKDNPETQHIPVIFVTARAENEDEELGLRLGAMDYIAKPFHLPIVLARVRNHINLKLKTDLLESHALLDGLTNIPNRRRFDQTLESEWRRAQRGGMPMSLLMFDIDHFKLYNDNRGHRDGDACLALVAATLADSVVRPADLVARYGGEEFVALLPETDEEGAMAIAERCRANVEAQKLPHGHSATSAWVTVSVGVACCVPDARGAAESLLEKADAQLYRAKAGGRNRVCRALMES
ncbi:MAG: diguanylate cyclase [Pseudomonadota bacterium]